MSITKDGGEKGRLSPYVTRLTVTKGRDRLGSVSRTESEKEHRNTSTEDSVEDKTTILTRSLWVVFDTRVMKRMSVTPLRKSRT